MADSLDAHLDRYRVLAAQHAATDFGSRASVRRGNDAADELRDLATQVLAGGQAAVAAFGELLTEADATRAWAAHHVLELMAASPALRGRALAVIEERARGSDANSFGERLWLQQWYDAHPEDRTPVAPAV